MSIMLSLNLNSSVSVMISTLKLLPIKELGVKSLKDRSNLDAWLNIKLSDALVIESGWWEETNPTPKHKLYIRGMSIEEHQNSLISKNDLDLLNLNIDCLYSLSQMLTGAVRTILDAYLVRSYSSGESLNFDYGIIGKEAIIITAGTYSE